MQVFSRTPNAVNRRRFLWNGTRVLAGFVLGFNRLPSAMAGPADESGSKQSPCIALIVDDIGYSRSLARQFVRLNLPMTFSILPRLAYSRELAVEIQDQGYEVMLHQPMEPTNSRFDPGPGALFVGDKTEQIERILDENISSLPIAAGMNNHMGSRFTESPEDIRKTLMHIKSKGMFFIDSYTSSQSVAYDTARQCHLSAAYRHVFLDNSVDVASILLQLHHLKQHAIKYGRAIGIGHPHRETAYAIGRFAKRLERTGIELVSASQILSRG